ncbi:hypothetical protein D5085_01515 [Ectothiorhodospiraceae bacterium BW-2]|nr:hypothetical protein D5085_01515 [Ectothiorhodospiraceae bacterium BW-2]
MKYQLLLFLGLFLLINSSYADTLEPSDTPPSNSKNCMVKDVEPLSGSQLADLLSASRLKRNELRDKLFQLDMSGYETRIVAKFERYWFQPEVQQQFNDFYSELESELNQITIEQSSMDVISAKMDTFWGTVKNTVKCWFKNCDLEDEEINEKLTVIIDNFSEKAIDKIKPLQTQFIEQQVRQFGPEVQRLRDEETERLANEIAALTNDYFPSLQPETIYLATLNVSKQQQLNDIRNSSELSQGDIPDIGNAMVGAIILAMNRTMQRVIVRSVAGKVVGGVASKMIPILGWVLIAGDAWSAAHAKEGMEQELREGFMQVYRANLAPATFIDFTNDHNDQNSAYSIVFNGLNRVQHQVSDEINQLLTLPELVLVNPCINSYINARLEAGDLMEHIAKDIVAMGQQFGIEAMRYLAPQQMQHLMTQLPTGAPSQFIGKVVSQYRDQFWPLYEQHGALLLESSFVMGIEPTAWLIEAKRSLPNTLQQFRQHQLQHASLTAKKGFSLAIRLELDLQDRGWSVTRFETLSQHEEAVRLLHQSGINQAKLMPLLSQPALLPQLQQRCNEGGCEVIKAVVQQWSVTELVNGIDTPLVDKLMSLYRTEPEFTLQLLESLNYAKLHQLLREEGTVSALQRYVAEERQQGGTQEQLVQQLHRDPQLLSLYQQLGREGVALYRYYYPDPIAGEAARKLATAAIALVQQGYSYDELRDADLVQFATEYEWAPKWLVRLIHQWVPKLILLVVFIIITALTYRSFLWARRGRGAKAASKPVPAVSPSAGFQTRAIDTVDYSVSSDETASTDPKKLK